MYIFFFSSIRQIDSIYCNLLSACLPLLAYQILIVRYYEILKNLVAYKTYPNHTVYGYVNNISTACGPQILCRYYANELCRVIYQFSEIISR